MMHPSGVPTIEELYAEIERLRAENERLNRGPMFDYIVNGGDELAQTKASLEHALGHLGGEIEENAKLRAANAAMLAAAKEVLVWNATSRAAPDTIFAMLRAAIKLAEQDNG